MGGLECIVVIILGPQVMSFVERFIILCPYLGEFTIGGSTVLEPAHNDHCIKHTVCAKLLPVYSRQVYVANVVLQ